MKLLNISSVRIYLSILGLLGGLNPVFSGEKSAEPLKTDSAKVDEKTSVQKVESNFQDIKNAFKKHFEVLATRVKQEYTNRICTSVLADDLQCTQGTDNKPSDWVSNIPLTDKEEILAALEKKVEAIIDRLASKAWEIPESTTPVNTHAKTKASTNVGGMLNSEAAIKEEVDQLYPPESVKKEDIVNAIIAANKDVNAKKYRVESYDRAYEDFKTNNSVAIKQIKDLQSEKKKTEDHHALATRFIEILQKEAETYFLKDLGKNSVSAGQINGHKIGVIIAHILNSTSGVNKNQNPFFSTDKTPTQLVFPADIAKVLVDCFREGSLEPIQKLSSDPKWTKKCTAGKSLGNIDGKNGKEILEKFLEEDNIRDLFEAVEDKIDPKDAENLKKLPGFEGNNFKIKNLRKVVFKSYLDSVEVEKNAVKLKDNCDKLTNEFNNWMRTNGEGAQPEDYSDTGGKSMPVVESMWAPEPIKVETQPIEKKE